MLAPLSRSARLGDQLGLDDEVNSIIADGGATGSRLLASGWHLRRRFANFQRQRGPAGPRIYTEYMGSARTAPVENTWVLLTPQSW
eukprot:scaffold21317_cov60-Phaeocystis_antarctica.AAC.3